jgi:hypothetical protein
VDPRPVPRPYVGFTSPYEKTDVTGRFRIRLARMLGEPPASAAPDTISVYVVAADPRSAGVGVPSTIRDSVLCVVTVAPVGTIPTATEVRIVLPVP